MAGFWPVHLLFLVLVTFFVGHFTLREDPETGLAELMRSGMREAAIYALLLGSGRSSAQSTMSSATVAMLRSSSRSLVTVKSQ